MTTVVSRMSVTAIGLALAVTVPLAKAGTDGFVLDLPDGSVMIGPNEEAKIGTLLFGTQTCATDDWLFASVPNELAGTGSLNFVTIWEVDDFESVQFRQRLLDPTGETGTSFGASVAVAEDLLVVGAPTADDTGLVHVFMISPSFAHQYTITPPTGFESSRFGETVAIVGKLLAIGAPGYGGITQPGAVLLYDLADGPSLVAAAAPYDFVSTGLFGTSLDVYQEPDEPEGDFRLVVGAPTAPTVDIGQGAVHVYDFTGGVLTPQAVLTHANASDAIHFGTAVAAANGRYIAVASRPMIEDEASGDVFIYQVAGNAWELMQQLEHAGSDWGDLFGASLQFAEDGLLVVGAPGANDQGGESGAVVLYEYLAGGSRWVESDRLTGYGGSSDGHFGAHIALSPYLYDGTWTLWISAPEHDRVYGFQSIHGGGDWTSDTRETAPVQVDADVVYQGYAQESETNGWSIATHGNRLVIGEGGSQSGGTVTVMQRDDKGVWSFEHAWTYPDVFGFGQAVDICEGVVVIGSRGPDRIVWTAQFNNVTEVWSDLVEVEVPKVTSTDHVGWDVAVHVDEFGDGLMVVSDYTEDLTAGYPVVHVYWLDAGAPEHGQVIEPPNESDASFGFCVDTNGIQIAVGSPTAEYNDDPYPGGEVVMYKYVAGQFTIHDRLQHPDNSVAPGSAFGYAISIDGDRLLIGAPEEDDVDTAELSLMSAGAAWIFEFKNGWDVVGPLLPIDRQPEDRFGTSVALDGDDAIIGAPFSDYGETNAGLIWRFAHDGWGTWTCSEALMLADPTMGAELGLHVAMVVESTKGDSYRHCFGVAPYLSHDDDYVGSVAMFLAQDVANMLVPGVTYWSDGADDNWSMPPSDAAALRFALWVEGDCKLLFNDDATITAGVEVSMCDAAFAFDSGPVDLFLLGDITVESEPQLGASSLYLDTQGTVSLHGSVWIAGNDTVGALYIVPGTNIIASEALAMDEGASLSFTPTSTTSPAIIACLGGAPSLSGTLQVDVPMTGLDIGDRHTLLTSVVSPDPGTDRFDLVVLESLGLPDRVMHLVYETVQSLQGTTWQIVAEIVSITDLLGFGDPGSVTVSGTPVSVVLVDLTGDGADEICVLFGGSPGELLIFENDGAGGVAQQIVVAVVDDPVALTAGDFDGDGATDLAAAGGLSTSVQVLFNDGDADLTDGFTVYDYALSKQPTCMATVDIDADGLADLHVGMSDHDNDGNGSVLSLHGAAALRGGGLAGGGETDVPGVPLGLDPSMEEDQKGIISVGITNTGHAIVLKGSSANNIVPMSVDWYLIGTGLVGVTNNDIDGDGAIDIMMTSATTNELIVLRQTGPGTFGNTLYTDLGAAPTQILSMDFNGDSHIDLAALTTDSTMTRVVRVLQNDGNLAFTAVDSASGDNPLVFGAGDVTGDGVTDLVTVGGATSISGPRGGQLLSLREQLTAPCPGDTDGNGTVNIDDLLNVIGQFGDNCAGNGGCSADIDGDLDVDIDDLLLVIGAFGPC